MSDFTKLPRNKNSEHWCNVEGMALKQCNVRLRTEAKKEAMVFFLISHKKFTFLLTTYE